MERQGPRPNFSVTENADTQVQMNYRTPGILQIPVAILNLSAMRLVTLLSSST
ncbi:hypothetical protein I79_012487 [Cricetulus griseus]|uniref:Uncharacterized protein n=1 Tax=Cricetulus griseus TaxID=10029 RepID=G3HNY6_CRIGR|nr:hypothetical protein I79_012487 [Cricetulus griseus]